MPNLADKPWFDPETGFLLLDEYVAETPSFHMIMKDGLVTSEEFIQQTERVTALLKQLEAALSPDTKSLVTEVLCELAGLHAITPQHPHSVHPPI